MEKSNKSSYTKNCHPEFISGSTPLVAIQNKEEMLNQVQHDNVNNDNNAYVEDPRQNSSGMTPLLTTQVCSLLPSRCLVCTALSSPSRVEGVPPLGGVGGLSKSIPFLERMPGGQVRGNLSAFTLIELLVVVLIIGVLSAVAVPQYKKAVLKSRFSNLYPVARSLAQAQESFYLSFRMYSKCIDNEQVRIPPVGRLPSRTIRNVLLKVETVGVMVINLKIILLAKRM